MHQTHRPAFTVARIVRRAQPLAELHHHVDRVRQIEGALEVLEDVPKVLPGDILHRHEVGAVSSAELVDLDDVRVREHRGQPPLVEEHLDKLIIVNEIGANALDHQPLGEARDPWTLGEIQLSHTANGDLLEQRVAAELFAHGQDGSLACARSLLSWVLSEVVLDPTSDPLYSKGTCDIRATQRDVRAVGGSPTPAA